MKTISISLNEKEYKGLVGLASKKRTTPYAIHKAFVLEGLNRTEQNAITLTIAYWYLIYSVIVAVAVLIP